MTQLNNVDIEIYKDIKGYEGLYSVSNMGNIMDIKTGSLMKYTVECDLVRVKLFNKKYEMKQVHILVAHAFLNPVTDNLKYFVKHIDNNNSNNKVSNLKWIASKDYKKRQFIHPSDIPYIDINTDFTHIYPIGIHKQIIDINKEIEIFVPIKGYENKYEISNFGNVWSLSLNKHMIPIERGGYLTIGLIPYETYREKKQFLIHRLVAHHFIPNDDKTKTFVDHIDNNKTNNKYNNLRWVTPSENAINYIQNHKPKSINVVIQYDLNMKLIKEWNCIDDILLENKNYKRDSIRKCLTKKHKSSYGFIWVYKNGDPNKEYIPELKEDEVFKNVGMIEGRDYSIYEISNYGTLRNAKTQQYLHLTINLFGYYFVTIVDNITKKNYSMKIHRIVAYVFKDKPKDKNYVNHINENKLDNRITNLEWVTNRENAIHSLGKKINMINIKTNEIIKIFDSISDAAKYIKCPNHCGISERLNSETRKIYYGYKWEYVNPDEKTVCDKWLTVLKKIKKYMTENKFMPNDNVEEIGKWFMEQRSNYVNHENEIR